MTRPATAIALAILILIALPAPAQVCNLKIVTDANPDYSDMQSMIRSITANWPEMKDKCWAMFYWNHIARRQTTPMSLHGVDLTDPIMQFNDYGYTMCSTISGINCGIWNNMGMKARYWDISHHTVNECFYDGRWHMYDDSLSAIYTLCDGKTIAGVEDIGAEGACEASGGRKQKGHIALYHCLTANSPDGFLTGADVGRDLRQEKDCFNPGSLKFRQGYSDRDWGHRYILNIRPGEVYTRYYHRLDKFSANDDYFNPDSFQSDPRYYVPNPHLKPESTTQPATRPRDLGDPESVNPRYYIRGNGIWAFRPDLSADGYKKAVYGETNIAPAEGGGLKCADATKPGEVIFKVSAANVIASQAITVESAKSDGEQPRTSISVNNGKDWKDLAVNYEEGKPKAAQVRHELLKEVNGKYEVLVKVALKGEAVLKSLQVDTITQVNTKNQPRLNIGRNTVYVGAGDQTESMVYWPDLTSESGKAYVHEMKNLAGFSGIRYGGALSLAKRNEEGYVIFKMDAPRDITRITYGAKMLNKAKDSHVDFLHSFDGGKTWAKSYSLEDTNPPWDVIHYETVAGESIPAGTKSVLFKYSLNSSAAGDQACSLYSVRMEADYKPADTAFKPLEVTFTWKERQRDYSLVERSHTELVEKLPHTYTINVGGADHPVMESLRVNPRGSAAQAKYGYSDGVENAGAAKWQPRWVTPGKILSLHKKYTVSDKSIDWRGGGDPDGTRMTDGVIGAMYAGGNIPKWGMVWEKPTNPVITVDLEEPQMCGAFRFHMAGWPWWDALKGEVKDKVELLTSEDGKDFASQGFFDLNVRLKDVPANHMLPDEETAMGWVFEMIPPKPVKARFVRFKWTLERKIVVTEVQVLDEVKYEPFDFRLAPPKYE
ncbi:MAG: hypothetical protein ACE15C_13240 [Phycisphaerae bacterium]